MSALEYAREEVTRRSEQLAKERAEATAREAVDNRDRRLLTDAAERIMWEFDGVNGITYEDGKHLKKCGRVLAYMVVRWDTWQITNDESKESGYRLHFVVRDMGGFEYTYASASIADIEKAFGVAMAPFI